jgi:Aspartyl aminopeptidase
MKSSLITSLQSFLKESPTPFHACENLCQKFTKAGFIELKENENWHLKPHGKYFVTRNHSAVITFRLGKNIDDAMTMIGAHTDSPCLKPKPNAISQSHGYTQCQVHVYGGALLNPWFDRDLSLAGKLFFKIRIRTCIQP